MQEGSDQKENSLRHSRPEDTEFKSIRLNPYYKNSWAVVIGINDYQYADRLNYAVNDADGIARLLIERYDFPKENVFVILNPPSERKDIPYEIKDRNATKAAIEQLLFTDLPQRTNEDDRVLIFFAGHGEGRTFPTGKKVGYLLPSDAVPNQWHTYISTDYLIEEGESYSAKHIFYLIDACYSGLAFARSTTESLPYIETMLTNRARQALTAGTAKEAVNDKGPNGHSPFTGMLFRALKRVLHRKTAVPSLAQT